MTMTRREATVGKIALQLLDNDDFKGRPEAYSLISSASWENKDKTTGQFIWTKSDYPEMTHGRFYQEDNGLGYILIVTRNTLVDIYPVANLPKYVLVGLTKNGPKYEGRGMSPQESLALKKGIAKAVKLPYKLSTAEEMVEKALSAEKLAAEERVRAEQEEKNRLAREARRAESKHIKQLVLTRPRISGFVGTAGKFWKSAIPVVGDEYQKLDGGTHCILLDSYDDENKKPGNILGCFILMQRGAEKRKSQEDTFSLKTPQQSLVTTSLGELTWRDDDGEFYTAGVYSSMEAVTALQKAGLNSGTLVAVPLSIEEETFQVVKVTAKMLSKQQVVKGGVFDSI